MSLRMFNSKGKKVAEFNPNDGVLMIPADDLRDRFAMAALPAILPAEHLDEWVLPRVAKLSYNIADAMMEARKS